MFGRIRKTLFMSLVSRGSPLPTEVPRPNLILAADCVYFEPAFSLLVQTLSDLADSTTEVLFCYKKRRKVLQDLILHFCFFTVSCQADRRFFVLLKKAFSWKEVFAC